MKNPENVKQLPALRRLLAGASYVINKCHLQAQQRQCNTCIAASLQEILIQLITTLDTVYHNAPSLAAGLFVSPKCRLISSAQLASQVPFTGFSLLPAFPPNWALPSL